MLVLYHSLPADSEDGSVSLFVVCHVWLQYSMQIIDK